MDVASRMGVVAESFEGPDGLEPPLVRILENRVVCEAAGLTRGTVSATSVVVRHECSGIIMHANITVAIRHPFNTQIYDPINSRKSGLFVCCCCCFLFVCLLLFLFFLDAKAEF